MKHLIHYLGTFYLFLFIASCDTAPSAIAELLVFPGTTIQLGETLTLDASSSEQDELLWEIDSALHEACQNQTLCSVNFTTAGEHSVTLTARVEEASDSITLSITVVAPTTDPVASTPPTQTPTEPTPTDTKEDSDDLESLAWSFVDGNTANGLNKDPQDLAFLGHMASSNGKLYAAWSEGVSAIPNSSFDIHVSVYDESQPNSWRSVNGSGVTAIDNMTVEAYGPRLIDYQSQLYIIWTEREPSLLSSIRVAVYNGDDQNPSWQRIDGGGITGLNYNSASLQVSVGGPQLAVFDSKLYATWGESDWGAPLPPGVISHSFQLRVAVYDTKTQQWTFADGNGLNGLNYDVNGVASSPNLIEYKSKLYATWNESNWGNLEVRLRIAVNNGTVLNPQWDFIDGNTADGFSYSGDPAATSSRFVVLNNKLYLTWTEYAGATSMSLGTSQVRAAVYDDTNQQWNFIDGNGTHGLNYDTSLFAGVPSAAVLNNQLYLSWYEEDGVRVAAYNGNDQNPQWQFVDGNTKTGLRFQPADNVSGVEMFAFEGALYNVWSETTIANNASILHIIKGQ